MRTALPTLCGFAAGVCFVLTAELQSKGSAWALAVALVGGGTAIIGFLVTPSPTVAEPGAPSERA